MSETPESVVRCLIEEGFNEGNLDVAEQVTSPEAVEHQSFGPNHPGGAEGVKAVITSLRSASAVAGIGISIERGAQKIEPAHVGPCGQCGCLQFRSPNDPLEAGCASCGHPATVHRTVGGAGQPPYESRPELPY
jgi:hypothetical protein